jgi:hypothetical protein
MTQIAFVAGSNGPHWSTRLFHAKDDAEQLGRCLRESCRYQVYSASPEGDSYDAIREIARISAICKPDDDLLIYFSGHGELVSGHLYLLLDQTSEAIYDSAIWAKLVIHAMELSLAKNKLLILDCCHAGGAVGFKGDDLNPEVLESGAEMVLCASNRIEKAREFPELKGSFLSHHLSQILASKSRTFVSLADIEAELKKRAKDHNASNPTSRVPTPYLFGEHKTFYVKRPIGRPKIELRFRSLFEPDMELLCSTLEACRKWTAPNILHKLPVHVTLPDEFRDRISTLSEYVTTDSWPCEVSDETKEQFRNFIEQRIPDFVADLIRAIRVMTAAAISADGSSHDDARNCILESYISSKTFATLRVFQAMQLKNEPEPIWMEGFPELGTVWTNTVIEGLTWISQQYNHYIFWTDADWQMRGGSYIRIYIPQKLGNGWYDSLKFDLKDYWRIFLPQILERDHDQTYAHLQELVKKREIQYLPSVLARGESFIETETHNSRIDSYQSKLRVTRIVAEAVAEKLKACPLSEREDLFFDLAPPGGLLDKVRDKVRELLAASDSEGG